MLNRTHHRGFTLIELAVTLAVLSLLLFAVGPSVATMMANARIRSMAESMHAGLEKARTEAIRFNAEVRFTLVTPNAAGSLDNTCAESATAGSWVVSLESPTSLCATVPTAKRETPTASNPIVFDKRAGGSAAIAVSVSGKDAAGLAASTLSFDSLGRIAAGDLRRIDLTNAGATADMRTMRIEMTSGGVIRVCEPDAAATDPRRCVHS